MKKLILCLLLLIASGCVENEALQADEEEVVEENLLDINSDQTTVVNGTTASAFDLAGSCTWADGTLSITDFEIDPIECADGTWSITLDLSSAEEGDLTLEIIESNSDESSTHTIEFGLTIDTTAPTVTDQSTIPSTVTTESLIITVDFSETVTLPSTSEITAVNATVSAIGISDGTMSLMVEHSADGAVVVDFPDDSVADSAGNLYVEPPNMTFSYTYDAP